MSEPSNKDDDKEEEKEEDTAAVLEKQDSMEVSSQLSVNSAFTEDSLNNDSGSDKERRTVRMMSAETSDTETDQMTTVVANNNLVSSPNSDDNSSLERERQEDLEVFGLQPGMFRRFEEDHEPEDEFFFDSDLNLEAGIDENIVAAELLRPERLDTVEEVSEPPSDSINSLPHDGVRWPEQTSQHTSLSTEQMTSLNSLATEDDKEEMFSQAEM